MIKKIQPHGITIFRGAELLDENVCFYVLQVFLGDYKADGTSEPRVDGLAVFFSGFEAWK